MDAKQEPLWLHTSCILLVKVMVQRVLGGDRSCSSLDWVPMVSSPQHACAKGSIDQVEYGLGL